MKPVRIQRRRTKGWVMPENTIYVGRGSFWGNEFIPIDKVKDPLKVNPKYIVVESAEVAVEYYKEVYNLNPQSELREFTKRKLKGKNLACWCKLNEVCHADYLLELANG